MAPVDWDALRLRLADAERDWGSEALPSAQVRDATLEERARLLAREDDAGEPQERLEVIVFKLAAETYALETRYVREVYPLKGLTPIPCTPSFVLGVINLRGELCPVIELKRLFDLPGNNLTNATRAIVVKDERMEFGILADAIIDVRRVPLSEIHPMPSIASGIESGFMRGITRDRTTILDAGRILAHRGLVVDDMVND